MQISTQSRVPFFCLLALFLLFLPGCLAGYIVEAGFGQLEIAFGQVPIETVLKDPSLSEEQKEKLRLILGVKAFGEAEIGFLPNSNYTTFYDTKGKAISYTVSACPPDSFEQKTWWFPIVGSLPYLGFFDLEDAEAEEKHLIEQGYEVRLSEVGGYSTLGWFRDPVFSRMLERTHPALIDLILHESTHTHIYIPNASEFNETLATFVAAKGTELYFKKYPNPEWKKRYEKDNQEEHIFKSFIRRIYQQLKEIYEEKDWSREEKLKWKAKVLEEARKHYRWLKKVSLKDERYPETFPESINNPYFALFKTYHRRLDFFEKIYQAHQNNLKQMVAFLKHFKYTQDPFTDLEQWLENTPYSNFSFSSREVNF